MTATTSRPLGQGHIPALDGIRGLAIFMVMIVHFIVVFEPITWFQRSVYNASGYGTLGIDLFFILSGFLITGILQDSRSRPRYFRNFFIRRLLRISPLYYAVLLCIFGGIAIASCYGYVANPKLMAAQPWAWTYLINFFIAREGAWTVPYIGHFWSLAVEEQFYMVWPFVVYYMTPRRLIAVSASLIVLSTLCHLVLDVSGVSFVSVHVLTPCRLNALCAGALMASWLRLPSTQLGGTDLVKRRAWQIVLASVSIKFFTYVAATLYPQIVNEIEAFRVLSWIGIFSALHLAAVAVEQNSVLNRFLIMRPLLFLGKYSYGIYVFHHFLSWPSLHYHAVPWLAEKCGNLTVAMLANAVLGMGLSILIAWISYHAFEKHFLRLKDIFAPTRTA
jgi:peptidoglycan/LPS O-acetylase OafA/YrhL